MKRRRIVDGICVAILVGGMVLASAGAAQGHAAIVSSIPAAGEELSAAPGVVTLTFSEPLIRSLSKAVVVAPDGRRYEGGPSSEREVEIRLTTNIPGIYRVEWKTVSPVDGHSLQGHFQFGVGVKPGHRAETTLSPRPSELALAALRALEYSGLLVAVGMILITTVARRKPQLDFVTPSLRLPLAAALVAGIGVVAGEAVLASSEASQVPEFLRTLPGLARLFRIAFEAAALALAPWLLAAAINVAFSLIALAAAGHAAAVRPAIVGITTDALHLTAAGMWAGGIIVLAIVAKRHGAGRPLLERFTPFAIPAFLVTVATGAIRGSQELATFSDLWRSDYGKVVAAKSIGVLVMVPLSILAWKRVVSRPRAEAVVAVAVIGAAALLAAFPLPPRRAAEAEQAAAATNRQISALPEPKDLTLGAYASDVLLAVTLRPGDPGVNQLLVYVLPVEGEEEAEQVRVAAAVGDIPLRLEVCGPTCRRASTSMRGGEVLSLQLSGTKSGRADVEIPPLPAAQAGSVLQTMDSRMRALRTLRIDEILRPAKPPVSAKYTLQAPDRFRIEVSGGYQSVTIGDVRYQRTSPSAEWEVEPDGSSIDIPFFIWGRPPFASAHLLGTEVIDGMELRAVGFFEDRGGLPIWFKQWIDSEGLVRRAEMRAHGHFMDHRYYDFDAPIVIEPPVGS